MNLNRIKKIPKKNLLKAALKRSSDSIYHRFRKIKIGAEFGISGDELKRKFKDSWREPKFFIDYRDKSKFVKEMKRHYRENVKKTVLKANKILKHNFDILGYKSIKTGKKINWSKDFISKKVWPKEYFKNIRIISLESGWDVKVPWELNRFNHLTTLGRAYWYTGEEKYAKEFVEEVNDWMKQNPFDFSVNWYSSMEVAIRAVNWVWSYYFFKESKYVTKGFENEFLKQMWLHADHIMKNLEYGYEFSTNHYVADGVGLVYLGILFPQFKDSEKWLKKGLSIISESMKNQVLEDGVDYEKSISYHGLVTELFLHVYLLCKKNGIELSKDFEKKLRKMINFLIDCKKPDGTVPLIGDSDDGKLVDLEREEPVWLGEGYRKMFKKRRTSSVAYKNGGFYIMKDDDIYLIIDCGELGWNGRCWHGHNDTLSFELFVGGKTLITDSGTYTYSGDYKWRNYFRSTKAHNTVCIDGKELSPFEEKELWYWEDITKAKLNKWATSKEMDYFDGECIGYNKNKPITHRRKIIFDKLRKNIVIEDVVEGSGNHTVELAFHFNSISLRKEGMRIRTLLKGANIRVVPEDREGLSLKIEKCWLSGKYGGKNPSKKVVYTKIGELPIKFKTLIKIEK